jgi:hypothetical protein
MGRRADSSAVGDKRWREVRVAGGVSGLRLPRSASLMPPLLLLARQSYNFS